MTDLDMGFLVNGVKVVSIFLSAPLTYSSRNIISNFELSKLFLYSQYNFLDISLNNKQIIFFKVIF